MESQKILQVSQLSVLFGRISEEVGLVFTSVTSVTIAEVAEVINMHEVSAVFLVSNKSRGDC